MTVYRVTGPRMYREHRPGDLFETTLEPDVEARALSHGAIEVVDRKPVTLQPGSWTLAAGQNHQPDTGGQ